MKITLQPIRQTGHNCKITAIATVDNYFATRHSYQAIPLHKEKRFFISIRELAKRYGSRQGEVLEFERWKDTVRALGYQTETIGFDHDVQAFKDAITTQLAQGHLILACFAVDCSTGLPTQSIGDGWNEHAAVIHGLEGDKLYISHYGRQWQVSVQAFFASSSSLPEQRQPEFYKDVKQFHPRRKYDLTKAFDPSKQSTIVPQPRSGFRAKLLIVKKPEFEAMASFRRRFLTEYLGHEIERLRQLGVQFQTQSRRGSKHFKAGVYLERLAGELKTLSNQLVVNGAIESCVHEAMVKTVAKGRERLKNYRPVWPILANILLAISVVLPFVKRLCTGSFFFNTEHPGEKPLEAFEQSMGHKAVVKF